MASELATKLRHITARLAMSEQAKLIDFTNVRSVKFIFNPFHERVESVRFVDSYLLYFEMHLTASDKGHEN